MTYFSIPSQLETWLRSYELGYPVSTAGFQSWLASNNLNSKDASRTLIDQALSKAVRKERLIRIAPGLFITKHPSESCPWPHPQKAVELWGQQTAESWLPAGEFAGYLLNFQKEPNQWEVWTAGSSRRLYVGEHCLTLKNVAPKWLGLQGQPGLVLRWCQWLGPSRVSKEIIEHIQSQLSPTEQTELLSYPLLPGWMKERFQKPHRGSWALPKNQMSALIRCTKRRGKDILALVEELVEEAKKPVKDYRAGVLWPTAWQALIDESQLDETYLNQQKTPLLFDIMEMVTLSPRWEGKDRDRELAALWLNLFNRWNHIPSLTCTLEAYPYFENIIAELSRLQDDLTLQSKLIGLDTGRLKPHHSLIVSSFNRLLPDFSSDHLSAWEEEVMRSDFHFRNRARQELLRWLMQSSFWKNHEALAASQVFHLLSKLQKTWEPIQWEEGIQNWLSMVRIVWDEPFFQLMEDPDHAKVLDMHPLFQKKFFKEKLKLATASHQKARI